MQSIRGTDVRADVLGPGGETSRLAHYVGIDVAPKPRSHYHLLLKQLPTVGRSCPATGKAQEEPMAA